LVLPAIRRAGWRRIVTSYLVQPRSLGIGLGGTKKVSGVMARLVRRWRRMSPDRLSDHLLRDAGLERLAGVTRRRTR
jgi:hypothetical protein